MVFGGKRITGASTVSRTDLKVGADRVADKIAGNVKATDALDTLAEVAGKLAHKGKRLAIYDRSNGGVESPRFARQYLISQERAEHTVSVVKTLFNNASAQITDDQSRQGIQDELNEYLSAKDIAIRGGKLLELVNKVKSAVSQQNRLPQAEGPAQAESVQAPEPKVVQQMSVRHVYARTEALSAEHEQGEVISPAAGENRPGYGQVSAESESEIEQLEPAARQPVYAQLQEEHSFELEEGGEVLEEVQAPIGDDLAAQIPPRNEAMFFPQNAGLEDDQALDHGYYAPDHWDAPEQSWDARVDDEAFIGSHTGVSYPSEFDDDDPDAISRLDRARPSGEIDADFESEIDGTGPENDIDSTVPTNDTLALGEPTGLPRGSAPELSALRLEESAEEDYAEPPGWSDFLARNSNHLEVLGDFYEHLGLEIDEEKNKPLLDRKLPGKQNSNPVLGSVMVAREHLNTVSEYEKFPSLENLGKLKSSSSRAQEAAAYLSGLIDEMKDIEALQTEANEQFLDQMSEEYLEQVASIPQWAAEISQELERLRQTCALQPNASVVQEAMETVRSEVIERFDEQFADAAQQAQSLGTDRLRSLAEALTDRMATIRNATSEPGLKTAIDEVESVRTPIKGLQAQAQELLTRIGGLATELKDALASLGKDFGPEEAKKLQGRSAQLNDLTQRVTQSRTELGRLRSLRTEMPGWVAASKQVRPVEMPNVAKALVDLRADAGQAQDPESVLKDYTVRIEALMKAGRDALNEIGQTNGSRRPEEGDGFVKWDPAQTKSVIDALRRDGSIMKRLSVSAELLIKTIENDRDRIVLDVMDTHQKEMQKIESRLRDHELKKRVLQSELSRRSADLDGLRARDAQAQIELDDLQQTQGLNAQLLAYFSAPATNRPPLDEVLKEQALEIEQRFVAAGEDAGQQIIALLQEGETDLKDQLSELEAELEANGRTQQDLLYGVDRPQNADSRLGLDNLILLSPDHADTVEQVALHLNDRALDDLEQEFNGFIQAQAQDTKDLAAHRELERSQEGKDSHRGQPWPQMVATFLSEKYEASARRVQEIETGLERFRAEVEAFRESLGRPS
jgi:hypothetical protein